MDAVFGAVLKAHFWRGVNFLKNNLRRRLFLDC